MKNIEKKRGLLIILSGPSGVGKGTIRRKIMKEHSLNLYYSISVTTRKARPQEKDGRDYYFVSDEVFKTDYIEKDNLLEYAEFVGHLYGTPKDKIEEMRNKGKNVIIEIEVEGAKQVMAKCKGSDVVSIFLIPPSMEDLEARIRHRRNEKESNIEERLAKANREIGLKYNYEFVVLNDDADRAANEIISIIRSKLESRLIK